MFPIRSVLHVISLAGTLSVFLAVASRTVEGSVREVATVRITVSDLDNAVDFYTRVLPFTVVSTRSASGSEYARLFDMSHTEVRVARLQLGAEFLELVDWSNDGRPLPSDSRSNDEWFQHVALIVSDMDRAYAHLREHGVQHVSPGPQTLPEWNVHAAGIRAFYFHDPEGHVLEILSFPPDKGDARWHASGDALFLGIDHTAIVVDDTEASLRFYRDTLGFRVAGGSENHGAEQERLNSVFAARLRITTLRAQSGPGVELLEYIAPPGGRPYPRDVRANDLVFWQTAIVVDSVAELVHARATDRVVFVSDDVVQTPRAELGFERSILVRDPDGHVVHLMMPPVPLRHVER